MNRGDWREPIFKDDFDRQRFLKKTRSEGDKALLKKIDKFIARDAQCDQWLCRVEFSQT